MPKSTFAKYKHTRAPALRRMLTEGRLAALAKELQLVRVQQQRSDGDQYTEKQREVQQALGRAQRLLGGGAAPAPKARRTSR